MMAFLYPIFSLIHICIIYPILSSNNGQQHFSKYYDIPFPLSLRREAIFEIRSMFNFGFDSYLKYAFPHDELKPVTGSYTDSLPELGNAKNTNTKYQGLALTLIDSLDSLLLFNRTDAFIDAHKYLSTSLHTNNENDSPIHIFSGFDIDLRVHVFETNIRILGGLLSAHSLSTHPKWTKLFFSNHPSFLTQYDNEFLTLATDLGNRLLPAFNTSNSIPFAWVNLQKGVLKDETRDTCTAGVGTLMLEMSLLSYFTQNDVYFTVAHKALMKLWKLRNVNNNLLGNSFNGHNSKWYNFNSGIGAGIDSFYEYLLKSYIYLGNDNYWNIFQKSYESIMKNVRKGSWYIETNIKTNKPSHFHFNSLQAFWPSLQILIGDIPLSLSTINSFFSIWYSFNGLPERFLLNSNQAHSTENQYPLRPELIESIFYAFESLQNNEQKMNKMHQNKQQIYMKSDYYLWLGYEILKSIQNRTKVDFGYTILNNVVTGEQGDYMPSYFLAETCKYLLLLFDFDHNPLSHMGNEYIFTTEAHIFPFYNDMRQYIDSVLMKDADLQNEDETYVVYEKYENYDIENDVEIEIDDDENFHSAEIEKNNGQNVKRSEEAKKVIEKKDVFGYNTRSIIHSQQIESIFINQNAKNAICPSSPFDVYMLMHHDENAIIYKKNEFVIEDGMSYLWTWLHTMFGPKDAMYGDKQVSTIYHDGNAICPVPSSKKQKNGDQNQQQNVWSVSSNNHVRISHDIGHFTLDFNDHSEKLEIFNLGTDWIEMTNVVPINSIFSSFYPYFEYIQSTKKDVTFNPNYINLNDVSLNYLFATIGPTKYEVRLKSPALKSCYQYTIYDLLTTSNPENAEELNEDIMSDIFSSNAPSLNLDTSIKASSAYFRPQPRPVTMDEIEGEELANQCHLERILGSGILIKSHSPSTSCSFPDNLAKIVEDNAQNPLFDDQYIVFTDRGECTFYEKVNVLNKNDQNGLIQGVIIGNVKAQSNIFTMGSDGKEFTDMASFMINKLSYDALSRCASYNQDNNMLIEIVEILTRCEEENETELNTHGTNTHFFVSSVSNSGFVVTQDGGIFKLSLPQ